MHENNRYAVTKEIIGRIEIMGVTIKKGISYYNIKDKVTGSTIIYNHHSIQDKVKVSNRCNYLNACENAETYIIGKDANNIYWIFVKTKWEYDNIENIPGVVLYDNVYYRIQTTTLEYSHLSSLTTGCTTLKEAQELKQRVVGILVNIYNKNIIKVIE